MDAIAGADVEELAAVDGGRADDRRLGAGLVHRRLAPGDRRQVAGRGRSDGGMRGVDGPRPLEGVSVVITGSLESYSRDSATEAVQKPGWQGQWLRLQEKRASWSLGRTLAQSTI